MVSRYNEMLCTFNKLSERNKDILILVARSIKVARDAEKESCRESRQEA